MKKKKPNLTPVPAAPTVTTRKVDETHRERLTALGRAIAEKRAQLSNTTMARMNLEQQELAAAKEVSDANAAMQSALKEIAAGMGITAPIERVAFDVEKLVFTIR